MSSSSTSPPLPPRLEVHVRVDPSGLHGGPDVEIMPHLGLYASMRDHRIQTLHPLDAKSEVVTVIAPPPAHQMRGDETLHGDQFTFSRDSFQEDLNRIEHDHVLRTLPSGHFEVSVLELARAALDSKTLAVPIIDRILLDQVAHTLRARQPNASDEQVSAAAEARATKGTAYLTVRSVTKGTAVATNGDPLNARAPREHLAQFVKTLQGRAQSVPYLLYGTPRYYERMNKGMQRVIEHFGTHFFASPNGGAPKHPLNTRTPSGDNLFLVQYKSNFGTLPVHGFFMARPTDEHLVPDSEPLHERPDAITPDTAAYYDRSILASLARHGRTLEWARTVMRNQLKRSGNDATVDLAWLNGKEVLADVATFAANELNYTSDVSFENPHAHSVHTEMVLPEVVVTARRVTLAARHGRTTFNRQQQRRHPSKVCRRYQLHNPLHFADGGVGGGDGGAATSSTVSPDAVNTERFDKGPVQGTSNSADCEDQSFVVMAVYEDMRQCAKRFRDAARFPALTAFAEMLDLHCVSAAASTVSSAMFNAEGKQVTREDLLKNGLPVKGSAEDLATTEKDGGHCTVLLTPTAITAKQLALGGVDVAREVPGLLGGRTPAAWEYKQGTQLLEGTGPVGSWIIPTAELHDGLAQQGFATRGVLRALRDKTPTLTSTFKIKAPGFSDARVPLDHRVSPFYHDAFFEFSPQLYAENATLGLFGVCEAQGMTRGVEFGERLRDQGGSIALVSPFRALGAKAWREDIMPTMACALNQMPATTLGRFADTRTPSHLGAVAASTSGGPAADKGTELASRLRGMAQPTRDVALARLGTALPDEVVAGFARFTSKMPWMLSAALDAHSRGLQRRTLASPSRLLGDHDAAMAAPSATTTLCLYTQPWRLQDTNTMDALRKEIAELKATGLVTAHQFLRDRPLPQCDDVVTLRLTIPIEKAATAAKTSTVGSAQ